jgi:hypothetical protein
LIELAKPSTLPILEWDLNAQETGSASRKKKSGAGGLIGGAGHEIWKKQTVGWRIAIGWGKFSARDLK